MSSLHRRLCIGMVLIALVLGALAGWSIAGYDQPYTTVETTVIIPPHAGTRAAVASLHAQGVTPSLPMVALPLLLSGNHRRLKAGEYFFEAGLSPAVVFDRMARGAVVVHKLSVPEGWNRFQLAAALNAESLLTGPVPEFAEGTVLPDTYHFTRNETRSTLIARMQKAQATMLAQLWEARGEQVPVATPQDAVILASVVERETGIAAERELIAGVFSNRLRIGMMLQSDPTVAYGIQVERKLPQLDRALTLNDLRRDTVYNSYTRVGLPPTPICNPGRASIQAVLHPAPTNALFFVATGHGGHVFADSLADHEANVRSYRAVLRENAADKTATPPKR